ncbi:hypothetical protein M430DRAFT_15275 [Amorphotheca resinae ATCC 22711]|uniref:Wax synthase domain-containing protein n=1 Tax=Amorphotheca resinae ATCC 22711 TaxID=857342 RepID=A0A2T3BF68_AMORE|nr:hypothetical protein M430DRAFT_15275 [Amorphotheca resinae ATCC 22711]PSS28041.1 hypothetical protein M430DRAFT_15275 [Amorphotheca resinae ATCC 22711]
MEPMDYLSMFAYYSVSMIIGIVALNSPQAYRPIFLVGIISFAILSFRTISDASFGLWGSEIFAMFLIIYISHMTCVLCVEKYVLPKKAGTTVDWVAGFRMMFNARWLGTHRQAPDIKGASKSGVTSDTPNEQREEEYSRDPSKKYRTMLRSTRAIFVRDRLISLVLTLVIDKVYSHIIAEVFPQYFNGLDALDFLPTKETYFRRLTSVTLRETLIRVWIVTYFIWSSMCLYTTIHDFLSIIFVGSGFDKPEDWPPLFGDIREATSIRNFWAKFWHRLIYRSYTSYGIWISKNILRLPRSSFIGKLFINLYVFAMSGFVHAITIRQLGYTCGDREEIRFYVSNFFGILVETAAMAAFSKITKGYKVNSTVSKTVGYTWVFMFLFTVLPKSQYPKIFCAPA